MTPRVCCTKPFRDSLKEGGLWLNYSYHRFGRLITALQLMRYFYILAVWAVLVRQVFIEGVQFLLTPQGVFIALGFVLLLLWTIFLVKIKQLEKFIDELDINYTFYREDWELDIIKADFEKMLFFTKLMTMCFRLFGVMYVLLPLLVDCIRAAMGYERPYNLLMPLEIFMEENRVRNLNYYSIVFASDLWFILGLATSTSIQCSMIFSVSYSTTEIKILKAYLLKLHPENDPDSLTNEIEQLPPWDLKKVVLCHQQIVRLSSLQNDCIALPFIAQNATGTLSICFVMFLLVQLLGKDNVMVCLSAGFILISIGFLFCACFSGEYLQAQSEDLSAVLYNIPWYRQSPKARKDILTIMVQASKTISLNYNRSTMNLPAFQDAMNNSYTYLMIMNSFL